METKICTGECGLEKQINKNNFYFNKRHGKFVNKCISCVSLEKKEKWANPANNEKIKFNKSVIEQENNTGIRICKKCLIGKKLNAENFTWRKDSETFRKKCINCISDEKKQLYVENAELYKAIQKKNRKLVKEKNKDKKPPKTDETYICKTCELEKTINKDNFYWKQSNARFDLSKCIICVREARRKARAENPEHFKITKKKSNFKNKKKYNEKRKDKIKNNIILNIREHVRSAIRRNLQAGGGSKAGKSINKYLPYDMEELREHIEKQFLEPGNEWMTWENWGIYNPETWDDNDKSTWAWQLDHIIPSSTFTYKSMDDVEFQECWALSNLRPYSAKQNIIDGTTRIRHTKKAA